MLSKWNCEEDKIYFIVVVMLFKCASDNFEIRIAEENLLHEAIMDWKTTDTRI